MSSRSCNHDHDHSNQIEELNQESDVWKIKQVSNLFKEQFGDSFTLLLEKSESTEESEDDIFGAVTIGKNNAHINFSKMKIEECNSNPLKGRVESLLRIGADLVAPLC